MKKIIANYFTFSKKERNALILILLIGAAFLALPYFFGVKKLPKTDTTSLRKQIDSLKSLSKQNKQRNYTSNDDDGFENTNSFKNTPPTNATLFVFDPNTLDEAGWIKLGIRERTAKTIMNYRSKGGKFRTAEDLRKIWGLRKEDADRLIPYVSIESNASANSFGKEDMSRAKANANLLLDANTATPEQLRNIPGIGSSLPYKIVKYREKLGGFLNMVQLKETYGMTDSIFTSLLPHLHVLPTTIKTLNINTASDYELSGHPYIDKTLAKAITIYRQQHGLYKSVDDIRKIVFVTEDVLKKVKPYLSVE
jgi:DNA uptake protein ComE-like DNA-binding protein